jgi:hypothetical protein
MRDHLVRRRDFHPLEDYLKIHPHVDRAIFRITTCYMPVSGPSWIFGGVRPCRSPLFAFEAFQD